MTIGLDRSKLNCNHYAIDPDLADRAVEMYESGLSAHRVAKELHIATKTVLDYVRRAGKEVRKPVLTDQQKSNIIIEFNKETPLVDIEKQYKIPYSAILYFLKTKGLFYGLSASSKRRTHPKEQLCVNTTFGIYKKMAENRKLTFNLTLEQVKELIFKPCFYCGRKNVNLGTKNCGSVKHNGIDRKDSDLGYEINNVVSCCGECNRAKSTRTVEQFYLIVKRIYENLSLNNSSLELVNISDYIFGRRGKMKVK